MPPFLSPNWPSWTFQPIGVVQSPYLDRIEAPHQAVVSHGTLAGTAVEGVIALSPTLPEACLRDLEGFERLWVVWVFHRSDGTRELLAERPVAITDVWRLRRHRKLHLHPHAAFRPVRGVQTCAVPPLKHDRSPVGHEILRRPLAWRQLIRERVCHAVGHHRPVRQVGCAIDVKLPPRGGRRDGQHHRFGPRCSRGGGFVGGGR